MAYLLHKIANIIYAETAGQLPSVEISRLLTDSRKLIYPNKTLFFALSGAANNGMFFIEELYQNGVRAFVVNKSFAAEVNYTGAFF